MKKKLFLLPLTLAALAPTITMVGCGTNSFEILNYFKDTESLLFFRENINLSANKWYTVNVDISRYQPTFVGCDWSFMIVKSFASKKTISKITKANVWINDVQLNQIDQTEGKDPDINEFMIQKSEDDVASQILGGAHALDMKPKVKIEFQISEQVEMWVLLLAIDTHFSINTLK